MDLRRAAKAVKELGLPPYRLEQARRAVFGHAVSSYEDISVLPLALRAELSKTAPILCLAPRELLVSPDGRARKAALALLDAKVVETVLLRPSPRRWTACVSTQVGCAFGCAFCATGRMGFVRDLTAEEITDQVLFWRQHMRREGLEGGLDNVVYMGMGEPLANYEAVAESLRNLIDRRQHGIGARHVSVSTVGIPQGIERFAADFPQINLAVSLHAAEDELRSRLVPANKAFPLADLARALGKYLGSSSRKVLLEYALFSGVNDRPADADALVAFVRRLGRPELFHVNLILYNPTNPTTASLRPTSEPEARRFQDRLLAAGLKATLRQSLGADIQGACGQLVSERSPDGRQP
ncbi:MAG: 23S rRNA (adenine(2503)-C(2))-methyltransferase RlmN [Elusimicrobia bacterium]|nr:23S rRNA (adenine(2503)-C(2))-methyltransferase RlmN [Elusimicrobiota bacterium]